MILNNAIEHTKYAPIKQNTKEYNRILSLLSLKCYWPKYFKSDSLSKNISNCTFTERVASVNAKIYKINFYNPKIPISFWYRIVDILEKSVGVGGRGFGWHGFRMEPN